jgi:hypothetical protein
MTINAMPARTEPRKRVTIPQITSTTAAIPRMGPILFSLVRVFFHKRNTRVTSTCNIRHRFSRGSTGYPLLVIEGIELLRTKRGDERVTFGEIADHLAEYQDLYPDEADAAHRFAAFLARVEDIDHDHDEATG